MEIWVLWKTSVHYAQEAAMTLKIAIGAKAHKNAISKDFLSTLRLSPFLGQKLAIV